MRPVEKGVAGKTLEFIVAKPNLYILRDLTGHSAWVTFSYAGMPPHVQRAAAVLDASKGIVGYDTQGDEFPTDGICWVQLTVSKPNEDIGTWRGFFETSFQEVRRVVAST
jgi:hypothetical protein